MIIYCCEQFSVKLYDLIVVLFSLQTNFSTVQSARLWPGQARQIHSIDGHCCGRRLSLQIPQFTMDGGRKGRSGNAKTDVHPPRLALYRGAVDAEGRVLPQTQTNKQYLGQAWFCKCSKLYLFTFQTKFQTFLQPGCLDYPAVWYIHLFIVCII